MTNKRPPEVENFHSVITACAMGAVHVGTYPAYLHVPGREEPVLVHIYGRIEDGGGDFFNAQPLAIIITPELNEFLDTTPARE